MPISVWERKKNRKNLNERRKKENVLKKTREKGGKKEKKDGIYRKNPNEITSMKEERSCIEVSHE
jgi:hypothetical protein